MTAIVFFSFRAFSLRPVLTSPYLNLSHSVPPCPTAAAVPHLSVTAGAPIPAPPPAPQSPRRRLSPALHSPHLPTPDNAASHTRRCRRRSRSSSSGHRVSTPSAVFGHWVLRYEPVLIQRLVKNPTDLPNFWVRRCRPGTPSRSAPDFTWLHRL
jgi:hypothetical protein